MWQRSPRGSWSRNDTSKMSDSNDEYREAMEGASLQIGDSVVAYTYPPTEGLIIDRTLTEEGRLELSLLIAPYKRKGKAWSRAKVSMRDAARLSKKPPGRFMFPLKGVENLRIEAKRAKADPVWINQVKLALDKDFSQGELSSGDSESDKKGEEEEEDYDQQQSESLTKKNIEEGPLNQGGGELERRLEEVKKFREQKIHGEGKVNHKKKKDSEDSDYEAWKKWKQTIRKKKNKKHKKKKYETSSSSNSSPSSSSSSSSSSENESKKGEVRERGSSGLYTCPFNKYDTRGFNDVKCQIQGQTTTRRHIRIALHNLYSHCQTLSGFADKMVTKANASANRPYTMDVAWFQAYAEHLDTMLLNSLGGPWVLWNEPVVDQMLTGFLELMMRIAPNKHYPACLNDTVRKWLKKKRVGTDTQFGPVPYAMQHAKFTEGGVVLQQNNQARSKERNGSSGKPLNNGSRTNNPQAAGGEKRPPPPS